MNIRRVVPNISTECMEESRKFYTDILGFRVAMEMDWIVTLSSPDSPVAQISLLKNDASSPLQQHMSLTIEVDDVDSVHDNAVAAGASIVYPLTNESWGVRRFHLEDPNGVVINVMRHIKQ